MQQALGVRRVIVVGTTCTGKSTLAARLARALDVPFVELDALYWTHPGWVDPDEDEFRGSMSDATRGDGWVVAGNYFARSSLLTWPRAEMVVWLDLPFSTLLPRVLRRSWTRWRSQELLWGTNTESLRRTLKLWDPSVSLIGAFLRSGAGRLRPRYSAAMADPRWAHIRFVRLCSAPEVEAFVRRFEESRKSSTELVPN